MVLFVLRKLILQTRMRSHPVGLDVWFLAGPFVYFHTSMCTNREGSDETVQMRRLAWAFADCLCDTYHNLMSWLNWCLGIIRNWLYCGCYLRFKLNTDIFSFDNPVPLPARPKMPMCSVYVLQTFVGQKVYWVGVRDGEGEDILKIKLNYTNLCDSKIWSICLGHARWQVIKILKLQSICMLHIAA